METSESIGKIAASIAAIQKDIENAGKNATATIPNRGVYHYADLAEILNLVRPALGAAGIAIIQSPELTDGKMEVVTLLAHSSGEWIRTRCGLPLEKATPQGAGSAITYARRYSLAAALGIAQEDDDAATAETHRPSPKAAPGSTQKPPEASSPYEARLKAAWTTLEALKPGLTEEDKAAVDKGVASLKVDGKIPRTEAGAAALEKMAESWKPRAKAGKLAAFEDDIPWEGESA